MIKKIVLGGGCFWGMQELFRKQIGVIDTKAGYSGGNSINPTYENHEGHTEVVEINYESEKTSFNKLLDFFFQIHDPTTLNQQGNDYGLSYQSIIFYSNNDEKKEATDFIDIVNKSDCWSNPVTTELLPLEKFYPAEEYHQDYLQKYPDGYTCHFVRLKTYL